MKQVMSGLFVVATAISSLAGACSDKAEKQQPATKAEKQTTPDKPDMPDKASCETRVTHATDALQVETPPWPTGDSATDALIEAIVLRDRAAASDPPHDETTKKHASYVLPAEHTLTGLIEHCTAATKVWNGIGALDAPEKGPALTSILTELKDCDCKTNIELVASQIWMLRAASAGMTMDPTWLKTPSELSK